MGTNNAQNERDRLKQLAHELGQLAATVGDFYDVAGEFARGWSEAAADPRDIAASAAYTTPVKRPAPPAASAEADSSSDQAAPAPVSAEHLRLELAALNELQSVCWSIIGWKVDDARDQHWPWSKVAAALEISKSAAHKRFGKAPSAIGDVPPIAGQTNLDV